MEHLNTIISWIPFRGYFIDIDMKRFHLANGCITFYDSKTLVTYDVKLDYGCSFIIPLTDITFAIRNKLDLSRYEVFGIRVPKKNKYDEPNSIRVYIPMKAVNFTIGEPFMESTEDTIKIYKRLTFNAEYFRTYQNQSHDGMVATEDRLSVKSFIDSKYTARYQYVLDLVNEIRGKCGFTVDAYKLKEILKHYTIKAKGE